MRHNTITGNFATNLGELGFGGGLSLFTQAEGAGISRIDARFNTLLNNGSDLGGGGIDVAGVTVPSQGSNGATFIEIANSRIENNTGFAVGGPEFEGPGSFSLLVRSSDLSPNTAGTIESTMNPVLTLVCMPATTGAQIAFPGVDSDGDVDGLDLLRLATAFASAPGTVHYNPITDLDGDLGVDGNDLALLAASFGQTCP